LRTLFGEQREFYKVMQVDPYGSFSPDSRYFQATSNEGWRRYLIQLIGSEDRTEQIKRINDSIARRIALMAKPTDPVACEIDMSSPTVAKRVGAVTVPETIEMRMGNKIFTVTEVHEDKRKSALMERAVSASIADASAQLDSYQQEFSANLKQVVSNYEKENIRLRDEIKGIRPALTMPYECLRAGMQVNKDSGGYSVYIPFAVKYKQIVHGERTWKIHPDFQKTYKGHLVVAIDTGYHVRWTNIYDEAFEDDFPLWHRSGGTLCLGTYEPKVTCLRDIIRVRDEIQKLFEKINLGSLGRAHISHYEHTEIINDEIKEYSRRRDAFRRGETEDLPFFDESIAVEVKTWTA